MDPNVTSMETVATSDGKLVSGEENDCAQLATNTKALIVKVSQVSDEDLEHCHRSDEDHKHCHGSEEDREHCHGSEEDLEHCHRLGLETEDTGPYDRGWAWMVVFGSFITYVLLCGSHTATSVFFVALLEHYQSTVSHTALVFALQGAMYSVGGLIVMNVVVDRLGCRKTTLIGGVLLSLSPILASLATDLTLLIFCQAILLGLADVMVISPGEVLIATYFRRRRSLAIGLAKCGASVGSMALPPFVTFLLDRYGLSGAYLLMGAICLHCVPAALLFRPLSSPTQPSSSPPPLPQSTEGCEESVRLVAAGVQRQILVSSPEDEMEQVRDRMGENHNRPDDLVDLKHPKSACLVQHSENTSDRSSNPVSDTVSLELSTNFKHQTEQERLAEHIAMKCVKQSTPTLEKEPLKCEGVVPVHERRVLLPVAHDADNNDNDYNGHTVKTVDKTREVGNRTCVRPCVCPLDFSLFDRPLFRLLFVCFALYPTVNMAVAYLPALAQENRMTDTEAAVLLTIVGGLDLLGRLAGGLLADRKVLRVSTLVTLALLILGLTYHSVRFMTSWESMVVVAVVQGVGGGVVMCMVPLVIVQYVGVDQLAKGLGFFTLASGSSTLALHPLLGYIRDLTGSYIIVYHVIGGCVMLAAILLCLEKPVRRRQQSPHMEM